MKLSLDLGRKEAQDEDGNCYPITDMIDADKKITQDPDLAVACVVMLAQDQWYPVVIQRVLH